jgi:predicted RNase H-like nuclease
LQTRFIGLDLAWSPRNNSAGVALEAYNGHAYWIAHCERLGRDEDVVAFVQKAARDGPALVAIDAPLIVPNEEGARPVDREITHLFGRYGAGCYPANRHRIGGGTRGEKIVAALAQCGFVQNPYVQRFSTIRRVLEVYPHPATITLFHLDRTLKYKARPHRSLDSRRSELARLREFLRGLASAEPAMSSPVSIMDRTVGSLAGSAFKHYEDLLDSALCAYIAYYAWYWGPAGYQVYGDTTRGYILVPRAPSFDQSHKTEYSIASYGGG